MRCPVKDRYPSGADLQLVVDISDITGVTKTDI